MIFRTKKLESLTSTIFDGIYFATLQKQMAGKRRKGVMTPSPEQVRARPQPGVKSTPARVEKNGSVVNQKG
jgi:hypothetical protein